MSKSQSFLNQDLVLKVNKSVDPSIFDINKYEGFIDALCGEREYQKSAIRNTLFYLVSKNYKNLTELAIANYHSNENLQALYGSLKQFEKHLQLPNQLSCSLDMATGTGKSYVIYGIARILLATGNVDYVLEDSSNSPDEKFQKIYDNHIENKNTKYRLVRRLTILITKDIRACNILTDDLIRFIAEIENISDEDASKKVLKVTSSPKDKENVRKLANVDKDDSPVEWITSVSMLTEGWDVKNVFQIVPHEERAFDSKLLIAQVLGRGLRIPEVYLGQKPVVTVFNHDRWSGRIKHLVDEILEIERRIYSYPVEKKHVYKFDIHNIDYAKLTETEEYKQEKEYVFNKGFITLIRQAPALCGLHQTIKKSMVIEKNGFGKKCRFELQKFTYWESILWQATFP